MGGRALDGVGAEMLPNPTKLRMPVNDPWETGCG